jgi:hypothetical protein
MAAADVVLDFVSHLDQDLCDSEVNCCDNCLRLFQSSINGTKIHTADYQDSA